MDEETWGLLRRILRRVLLLLIWMVAQMVEASRWYNYSRAFVWS